MGFQLNYPPGTGSGPEKNLQFLRKDKSLFIKKGLLGEKKKLIIILQ